MGECDHVICESARSFWNSQRAEGHLDVMRDSATNCVLAFRLTNWPTFAGETPRAGGRAHARGVLSARPRFFVFKSVDLRFVKHRSPSARSRRRPPPPPSQVKADAASGESGGDL